MKKISVITDTYSMPISIAQHGIATIQLPVTYPSNVEPNTPFNITYTVKNTGTVTDTLFGHLLVNNSELSGSAWTQSVTPNNTVTKTFTHLGITTNTIIILEVGHQ